MAANQPIKTGTARARRTRLMAEINVTPFVDVMLVLLVIFIVAAPLLVSGVPVELPKVRAEAFPDEGDSLSISVKADGSVYLQEEEVSIDTLDQALTAVAGTGYDRRVFVRADEAASHGQVMAVAVAARRAGFTNLGFVADRPAPGGEEG
jgi:biopolymer transport protein TolR